MNETRQRALHTRGAHLIAEYHGCDPERLDHPKTIHRTLQRAAEAAGATVLDVQVREYSPRGIAGIALLAESHLSVHTWPEAGYAAADLYTCGMAEPRRAYDVMRRELRANRAELMELARGLPGGERSLSLLAIEEHQYGKRRCSTVRIDARDGDRHGVRAVRGGDQLQLSALRPFAPGEIVFPLESLLYPADAEFLLETAAGAIPVGIEWDWIDLSPKWFERLSETLQVRLCNVYAVRPGDWQAIYDRMTSNGQRTRLLASFGEVARHSPDPNTAPVIEELTLEPGGLIRLPFVCTRPIAAGEEILWDHRTLDPTRSHPRGT